MFARILYPTDDSEHAKKALDVARELAEKYGAEVVVLHAYPHVFDALGTPDYERMLNRRIENGTRIVEPAAAALEEAGLAVKRELLEGPVAEAILNVAKVRECDLIVMGARGLSNLEGLLVGSVSQKVVQHATCPVLVVR